MKKLILASIIGAALAAPSIYAVDEHHPEKAAGAAKAPPVSKSKPGDQRSTAQAQESAAKMQQHMKKMQDIMARLQKTTDPAERQKLMDEHMQAMQEGMKAMRGMGGGGMMGMMGGGMMGGDRKPGAAKSAPMGRGAMMYHDMIEGRMDMMQMMMEQMMEHQKAMQGGPK